MKPTKTFTVSPELTARAVGSGGLDVLATPALVTMIENTCYNYLEELLREEETSVGIQIDLKHIYPSKIGSKIEVVLQEIKEDEKSISFEFEAFDGEQKIAFGTHRRAVVVSQKFLSKLL